MWRFCAEVAVVYRELILSKSDATTRLARHVAGVRQEAPSGIACGSGKLGRSRVSLSTSRTFHETQQLGLIHAFARVMLWQVRIHLYPLAKIMGYRSYEPDRDTLLVTCCTNGLGHVHQMERVLSVLEETGMKFPVICLAQEQKVPAYKLESLKKRFPNAQFVNLNLEIDYDNGKSFNNGQVCVCSALVAFAYASQLLSASPSPLSLSLITSTLSVYRLSGVASRRCFAAPRHSIARSASCCASIDRRTASPFGNRASLPSST